MMQARLVRERSRLPTLHARGRDRGPIDASAFDWDVPADAVEALAPEQLARPRDVLDVGKPVVVVAATFDKRRSGYAELQVAGELLHQELEVVGLERNVGIEASNHVEVDIIQRPEAGVETVDLR